jgi:putative ABC transport system ATP-binding protein
MMKVDRVSKVYRMGGHEVRALDELSLEVATGEFIAVMGPSGSGKSTLLHILGFLDRPSSGEYTFGGRRMGELSDRELARIRNAEIGFVFQTFNLLWEDDALHNVALPLVYGGVPDRIARAEEALRSVGLADRIRHRPAELSGGEQQRVAVARALVKNPALILADEPTGNLDTKAGEAVMALLRDLHARSEITIVINTHDRDVAAFADRIIHLKDGRIEREEKGDNKTPSASV